METAIIAIGVAIISAISGYLAAKTPKAGTREGALIDQLQEEVTRLGRSLGHANGTMTVLWSIIRLKAEYIVQLRKHIENGDPPPAAEYPEEIQRLYKYIRDSKE